MIRLRGRGRRVGAGPQSEGRTALRDRPALHERPGPGPPPGPRGSHDGGASTRSAGHGHEPGRRRVAREVEIAADDPLLDASDGTLATRARDGDVHAFEVIARRHGPLMRVLAGRLLGSDLETDDVVQESFLTAWRRLGDLDEPAHLRAWLMRIVSNRSIDRLRVRRDHDDVDAHDRPARSSEAPDRVVEARFQLDAMWTALDRLPLDQRRCWLLRETAGYSYAEIAEALDLPASTVRGQIARARTFLMGEMEAWR